MEHLPASINIVFCFTTGLAGWLLYKATSQNKNVITLVMVWVTCQSLLALSGFYTVTDAVPPRMVFLIVPPFILIICLLLSAAGKSFIIRLDVKLLTLIHVVRIPVELVLYALYTNKVIPEIMTFEGRNLDILAGLTAPLVYYFGFVKNHLNKKAILGWNFICLAFLVNIIVHGILSVPTPFQQFGFDQPNIAMLYFPYLLLPGFIVPVVLFSHVTIIAQWLHSKNKVKGLAIK